MTVRTIVTSEEVRAREEAVMGKVSLTGVKNRNLATLYVTNGVTTQHSCAGGGQTSP